MDASPNACGKKGGEFDFSGSITAASTSGTGNPQVGDTVHALACLTTEGTVKLVEGTSISR